MSQTIIDLCGIIDDIAYFPAKIDKDYNVLQLKKLIAWFQFYKKSWFHFYKMKSA